MLRRAIVLKPLAFVLLAISVIAVGFNIPLVSAAISTSYQVVTPRAPGSAYASQPMSMMSPRSVSGDGRYVVFYSNAADIVPGDTNGVEDVFVRDTTNNITTRVSVSSTGTQANAYSRYGSISYDGRFIVFESVADNLVTGVTGTSISHVYMYDLTQGTTILVDTSANGSIGDRSAYNPKVSADGRFVVFTALTTNLVSGIYSPNIEQIFIKDTHSNGIKILSITPGGAIANKPSSLPDISCGGNVVVFASQATNLGVPSGQQSRQDLVIAHLGWDKVEFSVVTASTAFGIVAMPLSAPQISCDGNIALFASSSVDVVSPSTPSGYINAYQYNRLTGVKTQVSLGNGNVQPDTWQLGQYLNISMSGDGRYVAFSSYARNVDTNYPSGSNTGSDSSIYIRDVKKMTTELVPKLPSGDRSNWTVGSVSISGDGSTVVFGYKTPSLSYPGRSLISGFTTGLPTQQTTDIYRTQTNY